MPEALLDTGVLVALIDRCERHHTRCKQAFAAFQGELLTSEAVLTEAQYLLAGVRSYHDTPMDFADATLVVLAEETGINTVFTLDRRGFETYRIKRHRSFVILPDYGH